LFVANAILCGLRIVDGQPGDSALALKQYSVGALNALEGSTDRIRLAAEHFELRAFAEIIGRFGGAAVMVQDQATVVKGSGVAAAARDRGVQRVERFREVPGKIGMNATTIQLFEHRILPER
jgi:hypothetical protein